MDIKHININDFFLDLLFSMNLFLLTTLYPSPHWKISGFFKQLNFSGKLVLKLKNLKSHLNKSNDGLFLLDYFYIRSLHSQCSIFFFYDQCEALTYIYAFDTVFPYYSGLCYVFYFSKWDSSQCGTRRGLKQYVFTGLCPFLLYLRFFQQ